MSKTTTKTGYEIRADLLGLAKDIAEFNYTIKHAEYEASLKKDGDQVVAEFKAPIVTAESIIDTAKKFNDFVTNGSNYTEQAQVLMENVKKFNDKVQESFKPETIQNNLKEFQNNVSKFYSVFTNGVNKH
jgi:gas vesicle protein